METQRLLLDRITTDDRDDYFYNVSHDRKVLETFICNYAETPEEVDLTRYAANEKMFALRLKDTGRLIGIILYFEDDGRTCEVGYGLGSDHWGKGLCTEALRRFLRYLFEEKGFHTVTASFFPGNDASRRVMEKCGMKYCRTSEKELTYLGAERDLIYYIIDKESFLKEEE